MKNFNMARIVRILGLIALVAVIGFAMTSCGGGGGGGSNRPGTDTGDKAVVFAFIELVHDDVYTLSWGVMLDVTYAEVSPQFTDGGAPLTPAGDKAGYLTGNTAQDAFDEMYTNYSGEFDQYSDKGRTDTFKNLVNYQEQGIGLPSALKTAMIRENDEGKDPIGAVFEVTIPNN